MCFIFKFFNCYNELFFGLKVMVLMLMFCKVFNMVWFDFSEIFCLVDVLLKSIVILLNLLFNWFIYLFVLVV